MSATARAEDTLDVTSITILSGRQEPRDGEVFSIVPIYEELSLIGDLQLKGFDRFRIVMSGWGSLTEGPQVYGDLDGDVDLGYVEAGFLRHIDLRLGRQLVTGGVARNTQMDGLSATFKIFRGLGVNAYGGVPVTPRFGVHRGDAMVGGRAFYRYSLDAEVGVSFIDVVDQGRAARQDVGTDARWQIHRVIALAGNFLWSLPESRVGEGDVAIELHPIRQLQITGDYRRTAPDLFLPRGSILAVFVEESRDEAGGTVFAEPLRWLRIYGDYHAILNEAGLGHDGGGKLTFAWGGQRHGSLTAEVRVLQLTDNGYVQGRLYLSQGFGRSLFFTLDGNSFYFTTPVNGQDYSFTGAATVAWEFAPDWQAAVSGAGDTNPLVEHRFEFMARLTYRHTAHFRQVSQ